MSLPGIPVWTTRVVPHAGDVDRNFDLAVVDPPYGVVPHAGDVDRNLSTGASIEIADVVPHAGDVDRNPLAFQCFRHDPGRPPRGGRG